MKFRSVSLPLVLLAFASSPLKAATVVWNAPSGDWDLAANWESQTAPVAGDDVLIANYGIATVRTVVPAISTLVVGDVLGGGTLEVNAGGSITTTTSLSVGRSGNSGLITIAGGSITAEGTGVRIGDSAAGTLTVENSGSLTVNAGDFRVGNGVNTGMLNIGPGGTVNLGPNLANVYFGIEANNLSTVEQTGGTLVRSTGENTRIGAFGATGIYNLSDGTATLTKLQIGFAGGGNGTINHSGGSLTNNGELAIGWDGGVGMYNLSGTAVLTTTERMRIGVVTASEVGVPSASVVQTGGTANISGRIDIGEGATNTGSYSIAGGTLNVTGQGIIFVGAFGSGSGNFTQTGGAVVLSDALIAGFTPGTTGTIKLDGGSLTAQRIQKGEGTGLLSFGGGKVFASADNGNFISGFAEAKLEKGGVTIDTNGHAVGVISPLNGEGSLTKMGLGTLTLGASNNYTGGTVVSLGTLIASSLGLGDVQIADGAVLTLLSETALGDSAQLTLGGSTSLLELNFTGTDLIESLFIGGNFVAPGTYSAADLNAVYAGQFSGTGSLIIAVPEPSVLAFLGIGVIGFATRRRRAV